MNLDQIDGCDNCADPVTVTFSEKAVQRANERIAIFKCPKCGCLILDDIIGFKGSGTVFRATQQMIDRYVAESRNQDCGYQFDMRKHK